MEMCFKNCVLDLFQEAIWNRSNMIVKCSDKILLIKGCFGLHREGVVLSEVTMGTHGG